VEILIVSFSGFYENTGVLSVPRAPGTSPLRAPRRTVSTNTCQTDIISRRFNLEPLFMRILSTTITSPSFRFLVDRLHRLPIILMYSLPLVTLFLLLSSACVSSGDQNVLQETTDSSCHNAVREIPQSYFPRCYNLTSLVSSSQVILRIPHTCWAISFSRPKVLRHSTSKSQPGLYFHSLFSP
jgi:hypothetical protein